MVSKYRVQKLIYMMNRIWKFKDKINRDIRKYGTLGHAPGTWEAALTLLPMPKGSATILNTGCGKFYPTIPNYELWHTDIRKSKKKGINFLRTDLNEGIPFKHKAFEGLIAMEIIEHLENPHHFLKEATRVATNWIVLTYPNNESMDSREQYKQTGKFPWFSEENVKLNGHITPIFSWQVRHIIKKLGWRIEDTRYNDPLSMDITIQLLIPKKK